MNFYEKILSNSIVLLGLGLLALPVWGADCLPGPALNVFRQGTTQLRMDVEGEPGLNYALERTGDFVQWTRVATNRSSSGLVSFLHPISPAVSQQFFRALTVNSADGLGGSFIFDGKTFAGWEGDTLATFRIADCAIVGGSLAQAVPENMFLCTNRRYTNFILRLEFKLVGTNGFVNSGVQFRSERIAGTQQVSGYQADLGAGYWGSLYDESRRNILLAAANQTAVMAVLKTNDWNVQVIQAEGARIRFWINGYQTIDYTEAVGSIPRHGIIGLQVHSGGLFEASFRRISLEVLP